MGSEWTTAELGTLCVKVGSGATPHGGKESYQESGISLIRSQNVHNNRFELAGLAFIDDSQAEVLSNVEVAARDVLLNITGDSVARACQVPTSVLPARVNQHVSIIRPDSDRLDPRFLLYWLVSPRTQAHMLSLASAGATRKALTKGMIEGFEISMPGIGTQQRIAHILGTLDEKIELNRRMNETLEAMAEALFKSWFIDFDPVIDKALAAGHPIPEPLQKRAEARQMLGDQRKPLPASIAQHFPDRFVFNEEMGWIPEGWRVLPILDVCDLLGGTQPPAKTFIDENQPGYVRLLQIRDFSNDNHITYVPNSPKLRRVEEDEILIGRYGSASGDRKSDSLGRICRGKAGVYNVALMKLAPILAGREYCLRLFDSDKFYAYLYGISIKAVQSGFSKKELAQCRVTLPSIELMHEYEQLGQMIWTRSKSLAKETRHLAQLRDTLLPKLLSGELHLSAASLEELATQAGIPDAEKLMEEAL